MALPAVAIAAMIGAAAGALNNVSGKDSAKQKRKLMAEQMRLSPWTGMMPQETYVEDPSLIGNMMQGGLAGASFGQAGKQAGMWGQDASGAPVAAPVQTQAQAVQYYPQPAYQPAPPFQPTAIDASRSPWANVRGS